MVRVRGLVLRKTRFGESSDVVHMLTGELGLLRFNALGLRRPKSRSLGALEFLNLSEVVLYDSHRELWRLKEAKLIRNFPGVIRDHARFQLAGEMADLLDKWAQPGLEMGDVLVLSLDFLARLENTTKPKNAFVLWLMRLLELAGVGLELHNCPLCGEPVSNRFSFEVGFVCENPHPGLRKLEVPQKTLEHMRSLASSGWSGIDGLNEDETALNLVKRFSKRHLLDS